ncbi:MAG: tetratricopeptide repeat protein [Parvularculaceae bacterium]
MTGETITAMLQRAAGLFGRGEFAPALALAEDALKAAPQDVEALHLKALALGRLGRIDEAAACYEAAAARHPQKQAVYANYGNALLAAGRFQAAAVAYDRATLHDPRFVRGWIGKAAALKASGDLGGAEAALRAALNIEPANIAALNDLGAVLSRRGEARKAEAMDAFNRTLALQPRFAASLINRGSLLREQRNFAQALADHRLAVECAPANADTHYQLANTLRLAGDFEEAKRAYAAALSRATHRADIHKDYARFLWELGDAKGFLDPLKIAAASAPRAELYELLAELAYTAGLLSVSEEAARAAIARDENSSAAWRMLAKLKVQARDLSDAETQARRALAVGENNFDAMHCLAEVLLLRGKFAEATALLAGEAPLEHLQRHIGMRALAMRAAGDPAYRRFYDYDRFTAQLWVEPPAGYATVAAFNAALAEAIGELHRQQTQPIDQTLFGGTQSLGRLWDEPAPVFQSLKAMLLAAAARYVEALPDDPGHPFLARKSTDLECRGAWSVILRSGGGHVDHIHPEGWISASYYVQVPEEVSASGVRKEGFLRLGASGVAGFDLEPERWFKPAAGTVVFFPSYMWHGVEPFRSETRRITAPFDLAPA